jgi:type VI secretion system protein ImpL
MWKIYLFLRSRWMVSLFVTIVLALLIWFCGPLLGVGSAHPLDPEFVRWLVIGILFVLWLVWNLMQELRARKREQALAQGIAETVPDPNEIASKEEIALLSDRLKEALKTLKTAKSGDSKKKLSTLPWYMFIGPPGAGKTTALLNCGLTFPLAGEKGSPDMIKGVGGTRNCDWLFADDAVFIDTAGRYTTQDSQAEVDKAAWLGFLRMLKKHRRRQPLNGVLVAISLSDLATQNEDERHANALAIRRRVRELQDELGVRPPVYVLFTKADRIAGFVEFFNKLSREERDQVWGTTFALDDGRNEEGSVAGFHAGFDALMNRLNEQLLERIQDEPDLARRRLIYSFPLQIASLRDVATSFLTEAFRPSRLEARPLLRGVYFTSGTQDGMPIDRLLSTMAAEFGLPRQAVTAFSGRGRSFFLSRLIKEVVFGEAALVGHDKKVERRAKIFSYGTYAACATVLLLLGAAWLASYIGNAELIQRVHAGAATYAEQAADVAKRGASDTDLAAALPPLNSLRHIRVGYEEKDADIPLGLTFGLYQGTKLTSASTDAYGRALNGILLPRMILRCEAELAANLQKPDLLYPLLKVYLILGRQGPLDHDLIMQWYSRELNISYPSEEEAPVRAQLTAHGEALLEQPLTQVALDDVLIKQARAILNQEPPANYSYNRIMRSKRVTSLAPWTVADKGGPGAPRVFQLNSGKSLDNGVPGIYTWSGYHDTFLQVLPTITQDLTDDSWVLGKPKRDLLGMAKDTAKLRKDVMGLYLLDYERKWDDMLVDISVRPFGNLQQALDELGLLAAPISPFRDVLLSIDAQTQLSRTGAADQVAAAAEKKAGALGARVAGVANTEARMGLSRLQNEGLNILQEAFGNDESGKPIDPAQQVDLHFKDLHTYVTAPDQSRPSPMEATIQKFAAMYQNYNQVATGGSPSASLLGQTGAASTSASAQLSTLPPETPKPVAAMLGGVAQSARQVERHGAGDELSAAWAAKVYPLCEAAFNRYPLIPTSAQDVPVDDFAKLLGPGGMMDQFFAQYLKSFVDITSKPWKWKSPDQIPSGLSPASLAEFERAAQIRDALFGEGKQVLVHFQLVPVSLDPKIGQTSVDIGGDRLVSNHGPAEKQLFQWPGSTGKTLVRVTMTPAGGGNEQVYEKDGPWALLRLLDVAKISPEGQPDKFRIAFTGAGGVAAFELTASSVNNPFTMTALRSFRCPPKL